VSTRTIHEGDGVRFLREARLEPGHAIITSLPDVSEGTLSFPAWRAWFVETAALACRAVHDDDVALFFQTDVKREGTWVDKGYLVQRGAEEAGSALLFHRVVCRAPPGTITFGRPAYAHLLGFSRRRRLPPEASSADVLPRLGAMPWARAMGVAACEAAVDFVKRRALSHTVVDPFCGLGTVLAVANRHGLHGIGVELSRKRAERARALVLRPEDAEAPSRRRRPGAS